MKITITGNVLRDKDTGHRNYVNLIFTVKKGKSGKNYHVRNYQMNARSNAHRIMMSGYDEYRSAQASWQETHKNKISRGRIEKETIAEQFDSLEEMEKHLSTSSSTVLYRLTLEHIRMLKNRFSKDMEEMAEKSDETFEERMERKIADSESIETLEKKSGFGKTTAAIVGENWGMF